MNEHLTRVCALSPHADDVALSIGGLLHANRSSWEITLLTVTTRSRYSRWDHLRGDESAVSELRGREDALYSSLLGAKRVTSPLADAGVRQSPSHSVFHSPTEAELALFSEIIPAMVASLDPETVLAPLGIGNHVDHCATTSVLLTHLAGLPAARRPRLLLYEDLPYAAAMSGAVEARVRELADGGTRLEPHDFEIDLAAKASGIAVYQSQYDAEKVAWMVSEYAQGQTGRPARERVWEARTLGASPVFAGPPCVPNW